MPELPEVEVVCRGLRPLLVGRTVLAAAASGKMLRQPVPISAMQQRLVGQKIVSVERRAKFLQLGLQSGEMVVIHLGMTGKLGFFPPASPLAKHDHVRWLLDSGAELRYHDSRRFGAFWLLSEDEVADREETIFKTTGPEPFSAEFSAAYLHQVASGRRLAVKLLLMTNQVVAGVGNIYANESLFGASIHPARPSGSLTAADCQRLVDEVRRVLNWAIDCGGSTISDFLNAGREQGYFQVNFRVYDRLNQPCPRCATPIAKITLGGRASYFCPSCQGSGLNT